jgi:hypothetical protein
MNPARMMRLVVEEVPYRQWSRIDVKVPAIVDVAELLPQELFRQSCHERLDSRIFRLSCCAQSTGPAHRQLPGPHSLRGLQRRPTAADTHHQPRQLVAPFLVVESAQMAVPCNSYRRRQFVHLAMRRDSRLAKVAMARKLAVRLLYWMWLKELYCGRGIGVDKNGELWGDALGFVNK